MAGSMEESSYLQYISLVAAVIVFITGIITQILIIAVNVIEWIKGRPGTEVDKVLTTLIIARTGFLLTSMLNMLFVAFWKYFLSSLSELCIYFLLQLFNLSDIWLTALFSVVYCLKICNFHSTLFLRLKMIIFRKVIHLIIASTLVSVFFTSMFFWIDNRTSPNILVQNRTINNTESPSGIQLHIFGTIVNSVPLFIYCPASLLILVSLFIHMKKITSHNNGKVCLDTYYKTSKMLMFSLICFILRIAANLVVLCYYSYLDIMWIFIIWNSFPTFHSIHLIHRTNKLNEAFFMILRLGSNCLISKRDSETSSRDPMEKITC